MHQGPAGMVLLVLRCTRVLAMLSADAPGSCWNGDAEHMATGPLHPIEAVASCWVMLQKRVQNDAKHREVV